MKYAFVTPRYGVEVVGGAELGARLLAEQLTARKGWEVEIFTTCALDPTTWADHYPPGTVDIGGVTVHRFASQTGRHPEFDRLSPAVLHHPSPSLADQLRWVHLQGPVCPDAVAAAEASDAELVSFYPYLYYPTVVGVPWLNRRAVLHPAAHDEWPIRLPLYRRLLAEPAALVFHTEAERRLVERLNPATVNRPQIVTGLGIDDDSGSAVASPDAVGAMTQGRPFLLYVGRVDRGKGCELLRQCFVAYKQRRPGPLALVFAGPVVHEPTPHPDVLTVGRVDDATKWGLLSEAAALVQPSRWESFSIVMLEAWTARTPVLVNGHCDVTRDHCELSGGGLWFDDYSTFEAAVDRLVDGGPLAAAMAAAGARYVDEHYRWDTIVERHAAFTERLASSR